MTEPSSVKEKEPPKLADVASYIRSPLLRRIYRFVAPPLEFLLGIRYLNHAYDRIARKSHTAVEFVEGIREELGITYDPPSDESLDKYRALEGPLIFVSNHPCGGLESTVIVPVLSRIRSNFRLLANFIISHVRELDDIMLAIDPYENQASKKRNVRQLKNLLEYLNQGGMISLFPSGEVSSFKLSEMGVYDKPWHINFSRIALKTNATVVPLYFHGRNSLLFQLLGVMGTYSRTLGLVIELIRPGVRHIRYVLGDPIAPEVIQSYSDPAALGKFLRQETYKLRSRIS